MVKLGMDRGAGGAPGLATSLASGGGSSSSAMQLKRLGLMAAVALLRLSNLFEDWILAFMVFAVYLVTGGSYMFYLAWKTLPRDLRGLYRYIRLLVRCWSFQYRDMTVCKVFSETVKRHPNKTCLIFEDSEWTFQDLEDFANKVANYFLSIGFKKGDCIALFMENQLEYVGLWLGCTKIGLVPALINANLQGQPLIHSIRSASCTALIYGVDLEHAVGQVADNLQDVSMFRFKGVSKGSENCVSATADKKSPRNVDLDAALAEASSLAVPTSVSDSIKFTDKLLYIYTSGTTGLPKAAVIKNSRFFFYCGGMYYLNNMSNIKEPRIYNPLPLYHSAGGVVGIGLMTVFGFTVVIRKKFSVRNFWNDCRKYNCNGAQYIGEICRYLLNTPPTPTDKEHPVQIMFGNGLRPQIWELFTARFGIERMGEFYGATEGNSSVVNIDCKPGSVGFTSVIFPSVYPVRLIRVNESGDVVRDPKTGFCILCKPGESGEFIGKIVKNHPSREFDGYVDKSATENKIVHNVLRKDDMWFRSGDLLTMDQFGWMYFVDRIGDTFRWRGENVSTIEVESVLSNILQQEDAIVYGVQVPGQEGRAGMAAIVEPKGGLDLARFLSAIKNQLPSYARPIFVRIVDNIDVTGTFKLKKRELQKEGFDPFVVKDRIFFLNKETGTYMPLDHYTYKDILNMQRIL